MQNPIPDMPDLVRLRPMFDRVATPGDWAGPIHAVVPNEDLEVTVEAVIFFTGTVPDLFRGNDETTISAVGYRNGPCGA